MFHARFWLSLLLFLRYFCQLSPLSKFLTTLALCSIVGGPHCVVSLRLFRMPEDVFCIGTFLRYLLSPIDPHATGVVESVSTNSPAQEGEL